MGQVVTTITADGAQMVNEQKKVAESAKEIANTYSKVNKEIAELDRAAKRTFQATRTDLERYNSKMSELGTLLQKNKIDQDTYNRAARQARIELEGVDGAAGKAFGGQFLQSIASAAAGFLSMATILGGIKAALTEIREESNRLGEQLGERFGSRGRLAQVATSPADFAALTAASEQMLARGAVPDIKAADELMFALRSTGQEGDRATFEAIGRTGLVDNIGELVNATDSLKDAMGKAEVGNVREMLSKGLAASAVSQTGMDAILINAAKAGAAASKAGVSDEEMLAAVATLTDPLGGRAEVASDRMRALFDAANRVGIKGGSLNDILLAVEKESKRKGGSLLALGSTEAAQAFDLLTTNREALNSATEAIRYASTGRVLDERLGFLERDPIQRAAAMSRAAAGGRTVAELRDDDALLGQLRNAISAKAEEAQRLAGSGEWGMFAHRRVRSMQTFFGATQFASEGEIESYRQLAREQGNTELLRAINELATLQREANDIAKRRAAKPAVPVPET